MREVLFFVYLVGLFCFSCKRVSVSFMVLKGVPRRNAELQRLALLKVQPVEDGAVRLWPGAKLQKGMLLYFFFSFVMIHF